MLVRQKHSAYVCVVAVCVFMCCKAVFVSHTRGFTHLAYMLMVNTASTLYKNIDRSVENYAGSSRPRFSSRRFSRHSPIQKLTTTANVAANSGHSNINVLVVSCVLAAATTVGSG